MGLTFPCGSYGAEFTCNDVAGGKVICLLERGETLTKITCKRGSLFETRWACSAFPEHDRALCRGKEGERTFQSAEFEDDANLCASMCYCPEESKEKKKIRKAGDGKSKFLGIPDQGQGQAQESGFIETTEGRVR